MEFELEKKYKRQANNAVLFCVTFFCLARMLQEIISVNFNAAITVVITYTFVTLMLLFLRNKNIKIYSFIVPLMIFIIYLVASYIMNSFKYYHCVYFSVLAMSVIYFNVKNYVTLFIVTQIINLLLSLFVLQEHIHGRIFVHFTISLSSGLMLLFVIKFAVDKSNEVNNAFLSFGALMRTTPNLIILIDGNNRVKFISNSVHKFFGIENHRKLIGKDFLDIFTSSSTKKLFKDIAKNHVFYEKRKELEINGKIKIFDIFADKMYGAEGSGMFFTLNDVSDIVKLKEQAERDSLIDSLTQIPNRRAFNKQLEKEWKIAFVNRVNLSFLMIDVDFFKDYNDTYGHTQGDELLKTFGVILKTCLKRSTDFAARLGGEEFGILLSSSNPYQANVTAEAILNAVREEVVLTSGGEKTKFTVSIGVSSVIPSTKMEASYLIENADGAMYKAKRSGRNQICTAEQ